MKGPSSELAVASMHSLIERPLEAGSSSATEPDSVLGEFYGQAKRAISTGKLNVLLRVHIRPIKLIVFKCPSGKSNLGTSFALICFQRLSLLNFATLLCRWRDNRITRGSSASVLSY